MPRIPTSKPQDVRRQASTGGKVDTRTSSGFFKSISNASAEVGQIFEEARQERQKIEDLNAQNIQKIDQTSALAELNESILRSPSNTHKKLIDEWASKHSAAQSFPQASKEASEAFKRNQSLFVQNAISGAMVQSARKLQAEAFQNAEAVQKSAVSNLNPEYAKSAWNDLLTGYQRVLKDREIDEQIEKERVRQKDLSDKAVEEVVVAGISERISAANTQTELDAVRSGIQKALNTGQISQTKALKEMESTNVRQRSINTKHSQQIRGNLSLISTFKNAALSGNLEVDELIDSGLDQSVISLLVDINNGSTGSIGADNPDYLETEKNLDSFWQKGDRWTPMSSDVFKNAVNLINDKGFTDTARLQLLSRFSAALYTDSTAWDIITFGQGGQTFLEIDPNTQQEEAAQFITNKLFTKMANRTSAFLGKGAVEEPSESADLVSAKNSLLEPEAAMELLVDFWNKERLEGITDNDSLELFKTKFENAVSQKTKESSFSKLDKRIIQYRKELNSAISR